MNNEELENYIKLMLKQLDKFYFDLEEQEDIETDYLNRFYDILDMFTKYEIIESETQNERN